jgi:hypothetical protein
VVPLLLKNQENKGEIVGLKHSLKQLEKLATETGSEITFMADGTLDWYWKSLRFQPEIEEVPEIIEAIRALNKIGFRDGQ